MSSTDSELFNTSGPNPGMPNLHDIHQGNYGDCYFLSSMGAIAEKNPQSLKDMIHANDNGTYTVTFYAGASGKLQPTQVTIDPSKDIPADSVDGKDYGHTTDSANGKQVIWPQVMEAAYAKLNDKVVNGVDKGGGYAKIGDGGDPKNALETLTGQAAQAYYDPKTSSTELKNLQQQFNSGKLIVVGTPESDGDQQGQESGKNPYGLVGGHAYTVTNVYNKDGKEYVSLNNPWGIDQPQDIPVSAIPKVIDEIAVGNSVTKTQKQGADTPTHPHEAAAHGAAPATARLDEPANPDHPLFTQARDAIHKLDEQHGRTPDQHSDNLAAALTAAAKRDGLNRIDHVVFSDDAASRTIAIEGKLDSPVRQLTSVSTAQGANTPIEQSSAACQQAGQQRAAQAPQQPAQPQQPQPQQPAPEQRQGPAV